MGPPVFKTGVGARAPRRVRFPSASASWETRRKRRPHGEGRKSGPRTSQVRIRSESSPSLPGREYRMRRLFGLAFVLLVWSPLSCTSASLAPPSRQASKWTLAVPSCRLDGSAASVEVALRPPPGAEQASLVPTDLLRLQPEFLSGEMGLPSGTEQQEFGGLSQKFRVETLGSSRTDLVEVRVEYATVVAADSIHFSASSVAGLEGQSVKASFGPITVISVAREDGDLTIELAFPAATIEAADATVINTNETELKVGGQIFPESVVTAGGGPTRVSTHTFSLGSIDGSVELDIHKWELLPTVPISGSFAPANCISGT